ncbi:hypothetical protein DUI87_07110 [Hirundo rustica rustica]|uniref:Uncharacterized protein n=1 Tax=Hirundo rustica rustica TaxID=333673 RepID=A0A3M0KPD8_HIRRU|nr:hypothetical protein DUI87_07110 [Hirundo rustica rustica]
MLREAPAGTRKNIPAAKKMDYPAAGGNPTGEGWSRGIGLWVTLVILSQAMCPTNGLHEPQEGMGMETNLPTVPQNLTRNRVLESRVRVDWFTPKRGENRQWNGGVKLNKSNHPMATARKRREVSSLPLITTCKECNKTVWIGGKKESTFVGYLQVNPLCYDKRKLKMCALNGKTYWVGQNEKLQTATLANGPILLDMLGENDERVCLRMDKVFCFSKDEEGLDPENKIQKVALEFKRQELAAKKKRMEQERMRTLSEQYDQLEKQSNDWSLATSSKNLFLDLVPEIATELGLTNCWICGGLKSAERWPWKGESLTPEQLLKWDNKILNTLTRPGGWTLDERVIGTICISREGNVYSDVVGYTPCLSTLAVNSNNRSKMWQPEPPNGYWGKEKQGKCNWVEEIELCWHELTNANPYYSLTELVEFWDKPENIDIKWKAPSGIYWICGKRAYSELPRKWKGSCTLANWLTISFSFDIAQENMARATIFSGMRLKQKHLLEFTSYEVAIEKSSLVYWLGFIQPHKYQAFEVPGYQKTPGSQIQLERPADVTQTLSLFRAAARGGGVIRPPPPPTNPELMAESQENWYPVGEEEAKKPYKYDCLYSENEKPVSEIELKFIPLTPCCITVVPNETEKRLPGECEL